MKIPTLYLLMAALSAVTVYGAEAVFPRLGTTYRLQYPEASEMQNLPSVVKVVSSGPDGWHLVEYTWPARNSSSRVHRKWINFNMLLGADEEQMEELAENIMEKPTGMYP